MPRNSPEDCLGEAVQRRLASSVSLSGGLRLHIPQQDAAPARQVGAPCPAAKGPGVADSSQAQLSLPAHWTLNLRGPGVQPGGRGWETVGVLALRKVERVPQQEAVSAVWTHAARRLGPARYRPPGLYARELTPTPPHLLDRLHIPPRSHPATCAHLAPRNENLPDKERVCHALGTYCVRFPHTLYLLLILRKSPGSSCVSPVSMH